MPLLVTLHQSLILRNPATFASEEFQSWCRENAMTNLIVTATRSSYHPATNGLGKRFIQSFKQAFRYSQLPPKRALRQFLIQYRRTPASSGYSPNKLLRSHQLPSTVDSSQQSPVGIAQGKQVCQRMKSKNKESAICTTINQICQVGDAVYAEHLGSCHYNQSQWIPAAVTKWLGTRSANIRILLHEPA